MQPRYIFVKPDGQTYRVVDPAGLHNACQVVRGQLLCGATAGATESNLEIVVQAAESYFRHLCGSDQDAD